MSVPLKILLYFIVDNMGRSLYVQDGIVKRSSPPVPLPQHPRGWQDNKISFGTNQRYWSLNRTYTIPMFFVGDGATICREAVYGGKGYEEELYIIVLKLNTETGVYELEYKGRLDLKNKKDKPRKGITVNAIQGGVLSYLEANEDVKYPIELGPTNPATNQIYFDGTNLADRYRYSIVNLKVDKPADFASHTQVHALPFPFISNEGDSVGVVRGSQQFELILSTGTFSYTPVDAWLASSANYIISSINPISAAIAGKIKFEITPASGGSNVRIFFAKNDGTKYDVLALTTYNSGVETVELDVNLTIPLAADEKLFLVVLHATGANTSSITWNTTDIYISFNTKVAPSTAFSIAPLDLWKQLVSKMSEGKYTGDSVFFGTHNNIHITSTYALRKFDKATVDYSVQDFFNDYDCDYNLGTKAVNDILYIEPKATLYNDDTEMLDLGEIAQLEIEYAGDLLCNTAKFGYKSQDYRQRNGKYEFNTTTTFKLPVNSLKNEYVKICKARGDCFGIEFERSKIFDKATTDSTGDNQPFMVNVKPGTNVYATFGAFFLAAGNFITFGTDVLATAGQVVRVNGSVLNNRDFTIVSVEPYGLFQKAIVAEAVVEESINLNYTLEILTLKVFELNRAAYSSITGVLDNTVYNIEEMTPHRQLQAHLSYLKSLLVQLPTQKITHLTSDKNADLVTTLAGVTIAEKQDEVIEGNPDILFYPYYFNFLTPVPLSFSKLFSSLGTGYITFTFLGQRLYALPIGRMDGKLTPNAAQTWKLLAAPKNSLATIKQLSAEGIFTTDVMGNSIFTSDLNPLHFNRYNYTLPAKYQHKDMYDDWFQDRKNSYISGSYYFQKWQKTEDIPIQVITNGLGVVNVEVYNHLGVLVETNPMNVVADPAVQLPYIKSNYNQVISGYEDGLYYIVLSSGDTKLRISELLDIRTEHPGTLLYEYRHTTNKYNTYFTEWSPKIRVESRLLAPSADSTFEGYMDELADSEVLDGIPMMKRKLRTIPIPDWLGNKLNRILLLNRSYIDGVRYSRVPESKADVKEYPGHDMKSYTYELMKSVNSNGLGTNEAGTEEDLVIAYTLQAQAFGIADPATVINIEVPLTP